MFDILFQQCFKRPLCLRGFLLENQLCFVKVFCSCFLYMVSLLGIQWPRSTLTCHMSSSVFEVVGSTHHFRICPEPFRMFLDLFKMILLQILPWEITIEPTIWKMLFYFFPTTKKANLTYYMVWSSKYSYPSSLIFVDHLPSKNSLPTYLCAWNVGRHNRNRLKSWDNRRIRDPSRQSFEFCLCLRWFWVRPGFFSSERRFWKKEMCVCVFFLGGTVVGELPSSCFCTSNIFFCFRRCFWGY